jgi:hypothetical protein
MTNFVDNDLKLNFGTGHNLYYIGFEPGSEVLVGSFEQRTENDLTMVHMTPAESSIKESKLINKLTYLSR